MNNILSASRSTAMNLANDAAHSMRDGLGKALGAITTGVSLVGLRDTGRDVVKAARRHPATTTAAMAAAVGAGIALWALRRSRSAAAKDGQPVEVEPIRVERKPARRAARKNAATARKTVARSNGSRSSTTTH